jgi:hypothetical protein
MRSRFVVLALFAAPFVALTTPTHSQCRRRNTCVAAWP